MTPIERVARALLGDREFDYFAKEIAPGCTGRELEWVDRKLYGQARAAILALATPEAISDEMVRTFFGAFVEAGGTLDASLGDKECYRRAIAAAIRAAAEQKP